MENIADYEAWKSKRQQSGVGAAKIVIGSIEDAPDQVAGDINLASEFGKTTGKPVPPVPMVKEYRSVFQKEIETKRAETILTKSPQLASWLRNPDNAAIARDDLENMSWFESIGRNTVEAVKAVPGGAVSSVGTGIEGAGQLLAPRPDVDYAPIREQLMNAAKMTPEQVGVLRQSLANQTAINPAFAQSMLSDILDGTMPPEEVAAALEPVFGELSKALQSSGQSVTEYGQGILPAQEGMEGSIGRDIGSGLGSILTLIATGLLTGPAGVGAFGGLMGAGEGAQRARESGASESDQSAAAALGVPAGLTDMIPVERFLNNPVTRKLGTRMLVEIGKSIGIEGGQEAVQEALQNIIAKTIYAPDQGIADGVWDSFVAGGAVGAIVEAGRIALGSIIPGRMHKQERAAEKAPETVAKIAEMSAQAQASKLRGRLPDKFREFVDMAVRNGGNADMFVPAGSFVQFMQGMNVDPATIISEMDGVTLDDFNAAMLSGGDLAIPTSTYLAKIAGTEFDQFFVENARFDPDGMSGIEAAEFNDRVKEYQEEAFVEAENSRLADEQYQAIETQIYDEMTSRLRQAGRSTEVATKEALLLSKLYAGRANRAGLLPEEYLARYPLPEVRGAIPQGMQLKNIDGLSRTLAGARKEKQVKESKAKPLLEFISEYGGINDRGELKARDAQIIKRAGKSTLRLSRIADDATGDMLGKVDGRRYGPDDVAMAAIDAGFMADNPTVIAWKTAMELGDQVPDLTPALYEEIDRELRGGDKVAGEFDGVEQYLDGLGLSLDNTDDEIRAAIEGAREFGQSKVLTHDDVNSFEKKLADDLGLRDLHLFLTRNGDLKLNMLAVPKDNLGNGVGTRAMEKIVEFADINKVRMTLTTGQKDDGFGTTSTSRLVKFYKRFGFVENKGRNKDFSTSDNMVRYPVSREFGQGERGSIQFPAAGLSNGGTVINLFETADLSTVIHETGHYVLELIRADSAAGDQFATDELNALNEWWLIEADAVARDGNKVTNANITIADVKAVLETGTTGNSAKDAAVEVGRQEQFARAFEAYLMEGKAPNQELRSAFEKFRSWLISIYKQLTALNVNVTPQIREVFDRMLASDAEIATARADMSDTSPVFATAESMGLTDDEYAAFMRVRTMSEDKAKATLLGKTMAPIQRQREEWFKTERASVKEEVSREINAAKKYRALEWITNKRWLGDGKPDDMPEMRFNKAALVEQFGSGVLTTLPRGKQVAYAVDGGMDPDDIAGWFGFSSGSELIQAMEQAQPRKEAIEAETDRVMREKHGDILNDGSIENEAIQAIHNEKRGMWIAAELKAIADISGLDVGLKYKDARATARLTMSRMKTRDAMASGRYLAAERKAGQEAARLGAMLSREAVWMNAARRRVATKAKAAIRGAVSPDAVAPVIERAEKPTQAYNETVKRLAEAKRKQLINHALYAESLIVVDEIEKAERFVAKLSKKSHREKIAGAGMREGAQIDYLGTIDDLLTQYDFRRMSGAKEVKRGRLNEFVEAMTLAGRANELAIPADVLARAASVPYKAMPVEGLRGVIDTLKNLEHTALRWNEVIINGRKRVFNETKRDIADAIRTNVGEGNKEWVKDTGLVTRAGNLFGGYIASMLSATTILRRMDGREDLGPAYEALKSDLDDAAYKERDMLKVATSQITEIFNAYSVDEQRQMGVKQFYPELNGSFSKWNLIAMALNMGNDGNLNRLTNDKAKKHLKPMQVEFVKSTLDARDAQFVQSVWDHINSYRPQISERDRRVRGVDPVWVDPTPVTIGGVKLKGGYYPIKYDGQHGGSRPSAGMADDDIMASIMGGGYASAATKDGHLKARSENVRQSLLLDISVFPAHVNQVVHDLTHSEAVVNTWKLLTSSTVNDAMLEAGLDKQASMLKLWVQDAATGQVSSGSDIASAVNYLRSGFTYSKLAFNFKTALLQPLGAFQSAVVVGKSRMARHAGRMLRHPVEISNEVVAKSRMMWERRDTFNKDVMDAAASSNIASPSASKVRDFMDDIVQPAAMAGMKFMQFYFVDVPTWSAAYEKGLEQFSDETKAVQFADMTINRTQGSGVWVDRSGIERGSLSSSMRQNPFVTLLTTLGSYFFTKMNIAIEKTQGVRAEPVTMQSALSYALDMSLLFAGEAIVLGLVGYAASDDDDESNVAADIAVETGKTVIAGLPVIRDIAGVAQGFDGGTYGSILKVFANPLVQAKQGEFDKAALKSTINLTGMILRLPSSQVNRIVDASIRESEGEDVSPMEYIVGRSYK